MAVVGKPNLGRRIFVIANVIILLLIGAVTLYPFLYVLAASLSEQTYIMKGSVSILPKGLNIEAYKMVFENPMIGRAYLNTIFYTVAGTAINLLLTVCGAYPLSRARFPGKKFFMFLVTFTMFFGGGMIPTFLVVRNLHMYNTIWAMLLPGAISTWNLIIMKTFFQQIPASLEESALIDGTNEIQALFWIILPLSLPSLATIGLFYAVGHWNGFFSALIYLKDKELFPLQILLRQIVIQNQTDDMMTDINQGRELISESIKFATIIVATLPILVVYPFIQKYFVKGVMVGAVKG
jgi:putative aldouronate transport system permease protein